jgi:hypothetical protein
MITKKESQLSLRKESHGSQANKDKAVPKSDSLRGVTTVFSPTNDVEQSLSVMLPDRFSDSEAGGLKICGVL